MSRSNCIWINAILACIIWIFQISCHYDEGSSGGHHTGCIPKTAISYGCACWNLCNCDTFWKKFFVFCILCIYIFICVAHILRSDTTASYFIIWNCTCYSVYLKNGNLDKELRPRYWNPIVQSSSEWWTYHITPGTVRRLKETGKWFLT